MRESLALMQALKTSLKRKGLKYRDVANGLAISEASVKRLFSQGDISLERLEKILSLMDMRLVDIFELLQEEKSYIDELTPEQEESLIKQPTLLLTFFLLLNGWPVTKITQTFAITPLEMIQLLAKLDKLKLIELLPLNKVKLLTSNNFSWRKNGPVQKFFEEQVLTDFFKSKFNSADTKLVFLGGTLSEASLEKIKKMLDDLGNRINQMFREDAKLPLETRSSVGTVLALRKWELSVFSRLRKS